jgi:hypothetical protein
MQSLCAHVCTASVSGGETQQARSVDGLQSAQPRQHYKEDFLWLFTFPEISNTGILINIFT